MAFLAVTALTKTMAGVPVVDKLGFTQNRFQKIAIAGETGSGKSTLLKMIAGLLQPDTGSILFENEKVVGPDFQLIPGHPGIAYLSQHYELRNNYRMEELLEYANKLPGQQAGILFEVCRISHLLNRKSHQLSGGEKQRIALARLLVGSPKLLLLDEPFSNLDPIHKTILKSVLADMGRELGTSCILTSHDPMDTLSWADEMILMKNGKLVQKASPQTVYNQPVNEYAGGLLGSYNLLSFEEATAVGMNTGFHPKGKRVFFRPEQVSIHSRGEQDATVTATSYWGVYHEWQLAVSGVSLLCRTQTPGFRIGEKVSIRIHNSSPWYV